MKQFLLLIALTGSLFVSLNAQAIFDANIHTAIPFGFVNSPAAESPQQAIDDDPSTKFLDFDIADGFGFDVDLLGVAQVATSIELVTANDEPQRDPVAYAIFGSNNGMDYELVHQDTLDCVSDRFLSRTFQFENSTAYAFYRVDMTLPCSPSAIMQIADVQLYATIGTAPIISCPTEDLVLSETAGECGGIATFDITATDTEDGDLEPVVATGLVSGSLFPVGTTLVSFNATDSDNNLVSCSFNVTVADTEGPTFDCPSDTTIFADPGQSVPFDFDITVADNCGLADTVGGFIALANINEQAYYLSTFGLPAIDAIIDAEDRGGVVGTIRDADANDIIFNSARAQILGFFDLLIGYTDFSVEGEFGWLSGDPSTYTNWNEGEPNNSGANGVAENFVTMLNGGRWNDVAGTDLRLYLLEKDYVLEQTEGPENGAELSEGTTTAYAFRTFDLSGNENSCTFNVTVTEPLNVDDPMLSAGLNLFPNPVNEGQVVLSNTSGVSLEEVAVYDFAGKLIFIQRLNAAADNQPIGISDLTTGIYYLRVKGASGIVGKKLIVR